MMPQYHAVIAAVATAAVGLALHPGVALSMLLVWIATSAVVAAVIDLDVMAHVARAAKQDPSLQRWTDPRNVGNDFRGFIEALRARGLLRLAGMTHLGISAVIVVAAWLLLPSLLVPVIIGVTTHLATDLQYLRAPATAT
jgi:hypothetical protein